MENLSPKEIEDQLDKLSKTPTEVSKDYLEKIINKLPNEYRELIENAFKYKRIPKEYMMCSILFTISTSVGLTFYMESLGYRNYGNLYFTIIGSRGDAKTEAMKIASHPLKVADDKFYDDYEAELEHYSEDSDEAPVRKQVLIQNASIEAAHKVHLHNPNSTGILIDEVYALIEKMGNSSSRDGIAWRNFLLEGYTNGHVDVSRKTTDSFRIKETYPTLLGGLQYQFLPKLFGNGNLESGFIDRILFTPKLTSNTLLVRGSIEKSVLENYERAIFNILAYKLQSENREETRKKFKIELSTDAECRLFDYCKELIVRQSTAKPVEKEYMSKMQISIHKFCIIAFILKHALKSTFATMMGLNDVELAIDLNEYFFNNFLMIIGEVTDSDSEEATVKEVIRLAKKNNASQKAVVEVTGKNKSTISRHWSKV